MFETLSAIALTASASIVVAFLSHALARTSLGRLTVAGVLGGWFALVLAMGATGALDPARGIGVPGLGLAVALPVAVLAVAFFSAPSIRNAMLAIPMPAMVAVNAIRNPRRDFPHSSSGGKATRPLRPERGLGRHFHRRHSPSGRMGDAAVRGARPSAGAHLEYDRDRGPCERGRARRLIRSGPASGLCRSAVQRPDDHFAMAPHSGLSGAVLHVPSRRHLLSAGENRGRGAGASMAQWRRGEGRRLGLKLGFGF